MKKVLILSVLVVFFIFGCGKQEEAEVQKAEEEPEQVTQAEEPTVEIIQDTIERDKNPIVVIETKLGTIEMELYWTETPKMAENFLRLVLSGFYDGLQFQRIVPGFVIQGGDPTVVGREGLNYTLPDEPTVKKHERGAVAMARSALGNSANQFYIALSKERTAHLDEQNFSVFAHVVKGMDVVDQISQVETVGQSPKEPVIMTKVYEKTQ